MTSGNASTGDIRPKQHFIFGVFRAQEPMFLNPIAANIPIFSIGIKRKAGMKPARNHKPLISKHFSDSISSELTVTLNAVKNLYLIDLEPKFSLERFFITFRMTNILYA